MYIQWKKIIITALDIILAFYLIMAVTAWNNPDEQGKVCTKVNIEISDSKNAGFLTAEEIKHILQKNNLYPLNKKMENINPRDIEETLKDGPFVKTAQCYSDLIIATGNINNIFAKLYIAPLAKAISASPFWINQIEQINVLPDYGIELVPRVGDHIIFMGYLPLNRNRWTRNREINSFVNNKLSRLEKFYRYGLSQVGWNKYSYIDIEFDNQIVCKRRDAEAERKEAEAITKEAKEEKKKDRQRTEEEEREKARKEVDRQEQVADGPTE